MKYSFILSAVTLLTQTTYAFPASLSEIFQEGKRNAKEHLDARSIEDCPFAKMKNKRQLPGVVPPFDAAQQYVSTSGEYAFVPPSGDDQRGPCPGLNAMANHGYLPHNGIGTIEDFITGCTQAFGMGVDLATFLAIYGSIFDGDLTSYSIGGPTPTLLNAGGLLGTPEGLSGSHNKYENDVSPTRGDLYEYGNDYLVQIPQFQALYDAAIANGDRVDLNLLSNFRNTRFQQSIANNPYFFNGPFSGVIVTPAAYTFIYRFMANKTAEEPEGYLNTDILKIFYSITGESGDFTYTAGWERFPENWYKRNPVDYYTIPYFALDAVAMGMQYPEFLSVGGNLGKTNDFAGVDPADLTNGVYNLKDLLEGDNLMCFGLQATVQAAPDILSTLYGDITPALDKLNSAVSAASSGLGCPKLEEWDLGQFAKYPGYSQLGPDGTYSS